MSKIQRQSDLYTEGVDSVLIPLKRELHSLLWYIWKDAKRRASQTLYSNPWFVCSFGITYELSGISKWAKWAVNQVDKAVNCPEISLYCCYGLLHTLLRYNVHDVTIIVDRRLLINNYAIKSRLDLEPAHLAHLGQDPYLEALHMIWSLEMSIIIDERWLISIDRQYSV